MTRKANRGGMLDTRVSSESMNGQEQFSDLVQKTLTHFTYIACLGLKRT